MIINYFFFFFATFFTAFFTTFLVAFLAGFLAAFFFVAMFLFALKNEIVFWYSKNKITITNLLLK